MGGVIYMFSIVGHKHHIGYIFNLSIQEDPSILTTKEMVQYYKIIFLQSGTFCFTINKKNFVLTGDHVLCINENDQIEFRKTTSDSIKILLFKPDIINASFHFDLVNNPSSELSVSEFQDLHFLKPFCNKVSLDKKLIQLNRLDSKTIANRIDEIKLLTERQDDVYWPCSSRACLFEILFSLARENEQDWEPSLMPQYEGSSNLAMDIMYYLQSCYNQKITIQLLANEFHTNRTSLINSFKSCFGQSINQYLIQLRLMMASTLLRDTELTIAEIGERTGYDNVCHFSKAFKKNLHYTPSEFRRIYEQK